MTTFTIDSENNITAHASLKEAKAANIAGAEYFASEKELAQLAASWPVAGARWRRSSKLIELWNSLPGVAPVKKFTDRQTALARIWKAAQALTAPEASTEATGGAQGAQDAPQTARSRKKASRGGKRAAVRDGGKKAAAGRHGSKTAKILALLQRPDGVSLKELTAATGWQAHSVRGFLSGSLKKKMGLKVRSEKREDGQRAYSVTSR